MPQYISRSKPKLRFTINHEGGREIKYLIDIYNHVLGDPVDLLLWFEIPHRLEIKTPTTLEELGSDALELLSALSSRCVVLCPDEMDHLLDPGWERQG